MTQLSEQELLNAISELIAIESTGDNLPGLRTAYNYMKEFVVRSGKDIVIEEFESNGKPSFLAYRADARPSSFHIILNGHLDVVHGKPEQFKPYIADGKLYGRGAYDMKAACVMLASAFCEFVDKVPYALALQIVTDEESAGYDGTRYQISKGVRGDFVICGDCGRAPDAYEIANEAKGMAAAIVTFGGTSAHGAYPWKGENAALKAAHFVARLHNRYPTPPEATGETTITVTSITTISSASFTQIPNQATARLDARYVAGDPNFRSKEHFVALLNEIDPEIEKVEFIDFSAPLYTSPHNPLLLSLKASVERVEGQPFTLVRRNGTSDGRFYGAVGNEACEFGIPGERQHGDDEYVPVQACFDYGAALRDFLSKTITEYQLVEDATSVDSPASV